MAALVLGVDRAARGAVMPTWWPVAETGRADGRRRVRDRPEYHLQQQCRIVAQLHGLTPWHLSQARASHQSAGWCDDVLTGGPCLIAVEYKAGRNAQTPDQRAFEAAWVASGGVYWVIRSVGELLAHLDALAAGAGAPTC